MVAENPQDPGKARAWSAAKAQRALMRDPGDQPREGPVEVERRHLAKAYLCGYAAALNSDGSATTYASEWMRLGMSPKPTGGGKRKSGEGRK